MEESAIKVAAEIILKRMDEGLDHRLIAEYVVEGLRDAGYLAIPVQSGT